MTQKNNTRHASILTMSTKLKQLNTKILRRIERNLGMVTKWKFFYHDFSNLYSNNTEMMEYFVDMQAHDKNFHLNYLGKNILSTFFHWWDRSYIFITILLHSECRIDDWARFNGTNTIFWCRDIKAFRDIQWNGEHATSWKDANPCNFVSSYYMEKVKEYLESISY